MVPNMIRAALTRTYGFAALIAAVLLLINIVYIPSIATPGQWPSVLGQLAPAALVAVSTLPSVIGGGLDISVGPLANFVAVLFTVGLLPHGLSAPWIAIPICLLVGSGVGALNGVMVAVLRYQPIVATLASFIVLTGINLLLAPTAEPAPPNWTSHLAGSIGGVPGGALLIGVVALIWFTLGRTAFHRGLYAVGGDAPAAYSAGLQVTQVRVAAYTLGGLFAGFAGLALVGLVQSVDSSYGQSYAVMGIAAVAVGGASLRGGRGGLVGVLMGACALYLAQNAMLAAHINVLWVQVVYGAFLIVGVVAGTYVGAIRIEQEASV